MNFLLLIGCGPKGTEQEQYADLKNGFIYKSYQKLSQSTVPLALETFSKRESQSIETSAISDFHAHFALAFSWATSMKNDFALAEVNLALQAAKTPEQQAFAESLLAFILYQKNWGVVAKEHSATAQKLLNNMDTADANASEQFQQFFAIAFLLLAFQEGNTDLMNSVFSRIHWVEQNPDIPLICQALMAFRNGDIPEGFQQMDTILEEGNLTEEQRESLRKVIAEFKQSMGVSADAEMTKTVVIKVLITLLMNEAKANADAKFSEWLQWIDELKSKVSI